MNKLSEEQINELLNDYEISRKLINKLETILKDYDFNDYEYYNIIVEIISEYQSFKLNKSLHSSLARPYNSLKDIIIKVLYYKLRSVTHDNSKYEKEVKSLILKLTDKETH